MLDDATYFPNLKTGQSELRAIANTPNSVFARSIPVFELTRSRSTAKEPRGSAKRRLDQLLEIFPGRPFILDLTTEDDLLSPDILALFDETGGYHNWLSFCSSLPAGAIPCLQLVEGGARRNLVRQAEVLLNRCGVLALRLGATDPDARQVIDILADSVGIENLVLFASLGFVRQGEAPIARASAEVFVQTVLANRIPGKLLFCGSSYPRAVGAPPYGEDDGGIFSADELTIFDQLKSTHGNWNLAHADYASVHPFRYPTRGGSWIPRIDAPMLREYAFERRRPPAGGYVAAAKEAAKNYLPQLPDSWGRNQIEAAARSVLGGASPSFWISVRINLWLTRTALYLADT